MLRTHQHQQFAFYLHVVGLILPAVMNRVWFNPRGMVGSVIYTEASQVVRTQTVILLSVFYKSNSLGITSIGILFPIQLHCPRSLWNFSG